MFSQTAVVVAIVVAVAAAHYEGGFVSSEHKSLVSLRGQVHSLRNQITEMHAMIDGKMEYWKTFVNETHEAFRQEYQEIRQTVFDECVIGGQFKIDQLRTLNALQNIKKIQDINELLGGLDFDLIKRFVNIINKLSL